MQVWKYIKNGSKKSIKITSLTHLNYYPSINPENGRGLRKSHLFRKNIATGQVKSPRPATDAKQLLRPRRNRRRKPGPLLSLSEDRHPRPYPAPQGLCKFSAPAQEMRRSPLRKSPARIRPIRQRPDKKMGNRPPIRNNTKTKTASPRKISNSRIKQAVRVSDRVCKVRYLKSLSIEVSH